MTIEDVPELRKLLRELVDIIDGLSDQGALLMFSSPWVFQKMGGTSISLCDELRRSRDAKALPAVEEIDGPLVARKHAPKESEELANV